MKDFSINSRGGARQYRLRNLGSHALNYDAIWLPHPCKVLLEFIHHNTDIFSSNLDELEN